MNTSTRDTNIVQKKRPYQALLNLKQGLGNAVDALQCWQTRAQQRRELKRLIENAESLKDIGLSSGEAMIEANKKCWQK